MAADEGGLTRMLRWAWAGDQFLEELGPGRAHFGLGEVFLVDLGAVFVEGFLVGWVGRKGFEVGQDGGRVVRIENPTDFELANILGDGGVGAAGEEDGAADGEGSEEFGGDDRAGPIFVEADQVDVGGGEAGFKTVGGGEVDDGDVVVVRLDGGAERGFAISANAEGEFHFQMARGAGEDEEGFKDVGAAEAAGVEKAEFGGAEEGLAFGIVAADERG